MPVDAQARRAQAPVRLTAEIGHRHRVSGCALAIEELLVDLGTVYMHPAWRLHAQLHLVTVQLKNVHGDVIADGDDFAYGTA